MSYLLSVPRNIRKGRFRRLPAERENQLKPWQINENKDKTWLQKFEIRYRKINKNVLVSKQMFKSFNIPKYINCFLTNNETLEKHGTQITRPIPISVYIEALSPCSQD